MVFFRKMHNIHYLPDVLIMLLAAIFIVVFMNNLKLSPVLGYLVMGALLGKNGLGWIQSSEYTEILAEFGVIFLLFVIGLELTFERLIKMRWYVFGVGSMQILITTIFVTYALRYWFAMNLVISITVASALALSSTAIVLQVLNENKRQSSQVGRISLAVLLMQDFAVVPLLTIIPILALPGDSVNVISEIGWAMLKAIVTIIVITIFGRLFLRPFFSVIGSVKADEVYVTTSLFIVLGASWLTNMLNLSSAMGAFLAGLLIAETEYRNKIEDSIMPFQGIFLALFFFNVGMSIDTNFIMHNFKKIILLAAGLIILKSLVVMLLCRAMRFNWGQSLHAGMLLSQGSEFAFILFALATQKGVIDSNFAQLLLMAVAVTMAVTPLLSILGLRLEDSLGMRQDMDKNNEFKGISDLDNHIVIAGFGRVGRVIAYMLELEGIHYVALDSNAILVKKAREQGFPIYHGDFVNMETLVAVGAKRAAAIILSNSDRPSVNKATKLIRKDFKGLPVKMIVRVEDYKHAKSVKKLGADVTVPSTIESGLQLGGAILKVLEIPEHEILTIKEKIRKNDYLLVEEIELFKGV